MSAAMEASIEKIDSIGFSLLDYSFDADFEPAKLYVEKIIKYVMEHPMGECKLLNVNIPACSLEEIKGIKICRQGNGTWVEEFQEGTDPRGEKYYWLTGKFVSFEDAANDDNDIWALHHKFVSIVPSGHDLTYYTEISNLKQLEK